MTKSRTSCRTLILVPFLFVLCLAVILIPLAVFALPQRAEQAFGRPAPKLSLRQRIYLSSILLIQANDITLPADPYGSPQPFQVQLGESANSVINRLHGNGLIVNAEAFRAYLQYSGLDTTLQAGNYSLSPAMTPIEIARALQDPTPTHVKLRILAGWRLEEVAAALPTTGLDINPDTFLSAARMHPSGYAFLSDVPEGASLEGFLFPGNYDLPRNLTADELVKTLLDNFGSHLTPDLIQGFERQEFNVYQAVILASIIQKETVVPDEMPLIASVFYNRLAANMKLDTDPTVQYALGYNPEQRTWWTNPLSVNDLKVNSTYNTYLYPGLPPGPIANPGLTALQAVAFPAQPAVKYYYFRAACDGSGRHVFSQTYEEHVSHACP